MRFLLQIKFSQKKVPGFLLNIIKNYVRSTTGFNLRNIMLLFDKNKIEEIEENDINNYIYAPVQSDDEWKIQLVYELINVKYEELVLDNLSKEEVDEIIEFLCTS